MKHIDEIIVDYLAGGELSREEFQYLEAWQEQNKDSHLFLSRLGEMNRNRPIFDKHLGDPQEAFRQMMQKLPTRRTRRLRGYSIAAGIALLLSLSFLWVYYPGRKAVVAEHVFPGQSYAELRLADGQRVSLQAEEERTIASDSLAEIKNTRNTLVYTVKNEPEVIEYNTLTIPPGAEYTLQLADGTKVSLNSGSELRFPVAFTGNERKVYLKGEAFFDVSPDPLKQFIVEAGGLTTFVLGTSFNIKSYPHQPQVMVTLTEGILQVNAPDNHYEIYPGTQVLYNKETVTSTRRAVDVEMYTSWKDGYYLFDDMRLEEIMSTLALWYNFSISYQDPPVKNIPFSGYLKRYGDIKELLKSFETTNEVEFRIDGNNIIIRKK